MALLKSALEVVQDMLECKARFPGWAQTAFHPSQAVSSRGIRSWLPLLRSTMTEVELRRRAVGTSRLTDTHRLQLVPSELLLLVTVALFALLLLMMMLLRSSGA